MIHAKRTIGATRQARARDADPRKILRTKHGARCFRAGEIPVDWCMRWYLVTGVYPDRDGCSIVARRILAQGIGGTKRRQPKWRGDEPKGS